MQKGIIEGINPNGFGFIKVEGMEKNLFFHANELVGIGIDELRVGDEVQFEIAEGPKGKNAIKVSKV